jgi:hypothetical protein
MSRMGSKLRDNKIKMVIYSDFPTRIIIIIIIIINNNNNNNNSNNLQYYYYQLSTGLQIN